MKIFSLFFPILIGLCSCLIAQADEYYSDDIFTAIAEAKLRTHHYDYSNALRYNRSTSQSIQIPRLLLNEMGQTAIETPELAEIEGQGQNPNNALEPTSITASNTQQPSMMGSSTLISPTSDQGVSVRAYINQ